MKNDTSSEFKLSRRKFLKKACLTTGGIGLAGFGYSYIESGWLQVNKASVLVPNLPTAFRGSKVALLTDVHHGPYFSLDYVKKLVRETNSLNPDFVMLAGDYVHRDGKFIEPCFSVLKNLKSRYGVFGVLGNHDHWEGANKTKKAMKFNNVVELTNNGVWIEEAGQRLRIAGVGDFWEDTQDLESALGNTKSSETTLLLSHNPDFVETIDDDRVGLVLSGHTHGGQIVLPVIGAPKVPSQYGQKYLHGLVKTECTQVFVSRGVGAVYPPLRFACRPEIVLITLS